MADGTIPGAVRNEALLSTCAVAMLVGGCPKRQAPPRIIYSSTPPAASAPSPAASQQTMVIEEPAAPAEEPAQVAAPETTATKPTRPRRRALRTEPPAASTEPPDTPETPPAEVPALEPRESSAQESSLRRQVQALQEDVRRRLARINEAKLAPEDHKTLEDARTFFAQSNRALEESDLQRALNLARKASLLVAALEQ